MIPQDLQKAVYCVPKPLDSFFQKDKVAGLMKSLMISCCGGAQEAAAVKGDVLLPAEEHLWRSHGRYFCRAGRRLRKVIGKRKEWLLLSSSDFGLLSERGSIWTGSDCF